jgi:predicted membrane chloride channel (bestrophin family)
LYPLVSHLPRHFHHYSNDTRPPSRCRSASAFTVPSTSTFTESPSYSGEIPSSLFKYDYRDLASRGTLIQGNLPLEIANYLTNYAEHLQADGRLSIPLFNALQSGTNQLIEVLTNCERILRTPIPLAYNIAISQTGIPVI